MIRIDEHFQMKPSPLGAGRMEVTHRDHDSLLIYPVRTGADLDSDTYCCCGDVITSKMRKKFNFIAGGL